MTGKIGPREQALREQREAKCKLDHGPNAGIPKSLCVVCTPRSKTAKAPAAVAVVTEKPRDPRIPKGMSTEEGEAMLARRQAEKSAKAKAALAVLFEKQRVEFVRINALRNTNGLPPLPDKFIRLMKTDPAKNEKLFARAANPADNGEATMKTESKKTAPATPKAKAKAPQKAPVRATEQPAPKAGGKKATPTAPKAKEPASKAGKAGRKGAFTPEVTSMVMAMLKKGATAKAIIDAAKWQSCPNPVKRVNRFVVDVAEKKLKAKVVIDGRGESAVYHAE